MAKSAGKANRLEYVDVARGIAMICIVLGHMGSPAVNRVVFTFHVPIFFLITGYFLSARTDLATFTKRRVRTILVPYFVVAGIVAVGRIVRYELELGGVQTKQEILRWTGAVLYGVGDSWDLPFWPWHVQSIGALWFLWASFWGSVMLRWLLDRKPWQRIAVVTVVFVVSVWSASKKYILPFSLQPGGCGLFYMYFGWLWRQMGDGAKPVLREARMVIVLLCMAMWYCFMRDFQSFWLVHADIGRGIIDVVGSLCACYALVRICDAACLAKLPLVSPLAWLGTYSLLALSVHAFDLHFLNWSPLMDRMAAMGIGENLRLATQGCARVLFVIVGVYLLSKIPLVRKVFGFGS